MRLWQRNAIGLAVVGVALGVLIPVQLWPQWTDYRDGITPQRVAAAGEAITVDGRTWQIRSVRHGGGPVRGSDPLPSGTTLQVVTIARSGADPDKGCAAALTDGRRHWAPDTIDAAPVAAGATSICGLPGPLQLSFVVPSDARPQAVDVTGSDGRIAVRLQL